MEEIDGLTLGEPEFLDTRSVARFSQTLTWLILYGILNQGDVGYSTTVNVTGRL